MILARLWAHPRARAALVAALAVPAAGLALAFGFERAALRAGQDQLTTRAGTGPARWSYPIEPPPVVRPPTLPAEGSGMGDDEEVIGVEVRGRARAYRLDAFRDRERHVVNDLLGDAPVSVAYCDITNCVRVYTDPRRSSPLDVAVAGLRDGEMVVKADGARYLQDSGAPVDPGARPTPFPYERLDPMRTTWKQWSRLHPGTDVYVGERAGRDRARP